MPATCVRTIQIRSETLFNMQIPGAYLLNLTLQGRGPGISILLLLFLLGQGRAILFGKPAGQEDGRLLSQRPTFSKLEFRLLLLGISIFVTTPADPMKQRVGPLMWSNKSWVESQEPWALGLTLPSSPV